MHQQDTDTLNALDVITNNQMLLAGVTTAVLLNLVGWVALLIYFWQTPPEVPLFFSLLSGIDQLAAREWLFLIPGTTTLAVVLMFFIITLSLRSHVVFHQLVAWMTALIALLAVVSLGNIFLLVF